jgi:hypothetical protein
MLVDGKLVSIKLIREINTFSLEANNNNDEKLAKMLQQMEKLTSMVFELQAEKSNKVSNQVKSEQLNKEERSDIKTSTSTEDLD